MILRLLDQQGFVQFEIFYLTLSFFFAEVPSHKKHTFIELLGLLSLLRWECYFKNIER